MDPKTEENERLNTLYAVTSFCNKLPTQTSHEEAKAVVMQLVKLILKQQATNSTNLLTSINLIQYLVVNHAKKLVDIVIYPDFNNVGNKVDIEPDSRFEDNEYDEDDLTITPSQNIIIETFMTHKFLHSEDEIPNCNVDYLITYCILRLFSKEELDNKCLEISNETLKNIISVYYKDFEFTHAYIYFTHLWACLKCTVVCILNETFDQEKLKPRDIYSAEIDKLTERFYSDIPLKNAVLKKFKFCLQPEITSIKNALAYLKRLAKIILYMMEQYEGLSNYCPRMLDFFIQLYQDRDDTEILEVLILMSNVDEFDSWVRPYSKTLQQNIFESVLFYASNSLRNQITLTEKEKENLIRQERIFSRALPLASRSSYSHGQTNFPSTDYLHNLVTTFYHSPPYDVAILISLCKYLCKYLSSFSDYHLIEKLGYNFKFPTIHSQLFNLMGLNQLIQYYWKEEVFDGEFYFDINPDILEHNNEDGYTDSELEAEEMG
ncbi:hypothetical protein K502DRAFT_227198 [Neoconidiobolus thromboides FSU 785]|nr:hypothetical protein K502DRAFT_227198 [Neoconidiobolus thromboides FSU 785]